MLTTMSKKIEEFPDDVVSAEDKKQALDIEFHWVNETGELAKLSAGLCIQPTDSFATCSPLDIILMGASSPSYQPTEKELEFIRKSYNGYSAFIAICDGFQSAFQAGLLDGRKATAPEPLLEMLQKAFPSTQWDRRRWQRDSKIWTSGTLLNGLDCMRAFGKETYGSEGTLMKILLRVGAWPDRDVYFNDVKI